MKIMPHISVKLYWVKWHQDQDMVTVMEEINAYRNLITKNLLQGSSCYKTQGIAYVFTQELV